MKSKTSHALSANQAAAPESVVFVEKIMEFTFAVLRKTRCEQIFAKTAIVRAYAELSIKYPEIYDFRRRAASSLILLSNLLECNGEGELSKQGRYVATSAGL